MNDISDLRATALLPKEFVAAGLVASAATKTVLLRARVLFDATPVYRLYVRRFGRREFASVSEIVPNRSYDDPALTSDGVLLCFSEFDWTKRPDNTWTGAFVGLGCYDLKTLKMQEFIRSDLFQAPESYEKVISVRPLGADSKASQMIVNLGVGRGTSNGTEIHYYIVSLDLDSAGLTLLDRLYGTFF